MVKEKLIYLPIGILTTCTALAGVVLTSMRVGATATCTTSGDTTTCTSDGTTVKTTATATKNATVRVVTSCVFTNNPSTTTKSATLTPGVYDDTSFGGTNGFSTLTATCNDSGGLAIYAKGASSDDDSTRNKLIGASSGAYINTGIYSSGATTSSWSMKLTNPSTGVTIANNYNNYHLVPADYQKVASYGSSTGSSEISVMTKYDVFPAYDIPADTYTGGVKYVIVNPSTADAPVDPIPMQSMTLAQCQQNATNTPFTVVDTRDSSDYTVRYIDGACWMTQNLRITGAVSSTGSNFNNVSSWNVHAGDLSSGDSNEEARSHVPTSGELGSYSANEVGVWYNFCAVSANNSYGCSNEDSYVPGTGSATGDICPAGWHLPTSTTAPGAFSSFSSSSENLQKFNPVYAGVWMWGEFRLSGDLGLWWSSTAYDGNFQENFYANSFSGDINTYNKQSGFFVRCVKTS